MHYSGHIQRVGRRSLSRDRPTYNLSVAGGINAAAHLIAVILLPLFHGCKRLDILLFSVVLLFYFSICAIIGYSYFNA